MHRMGFGFLAAMVIGCASGTAPIAAPDAPGGSTFLAASPQSFSFGDVPVGTAATRDVTLTNAGAVAATVTRLVVNGTGFSATGLSLPLTLAPGATQSFTVGFSPPAPGTFAGVVVLADAADVVAIAPTGTGVQAGGTPVAPRIEGVTVSSAAAIEGQTVQMTAAVAATGAIDTSVTWEVASGSLGTIDAATGVYAAPSTAGTFTVIATSVADATKSGSGTVTVTAAPPPPPPPPAGVVAAFPGAEGGGALSKGGRGGVVYEVTNLNDSGPGSLRECVEASGPRTCVFRVAGRIDLASGMYVSSPYLTVAGQTAPGDGIAINMATHVGSATASPKIFSIGPPAHDITIRYLRLWGDYTANQTSSNYGTIAVTTYGQTQNIIVDHCTMLWHSWEALDLIQDRGTAAENGKITAQWNLIGESVLSPLGTVAGATNQAVGVQSQDINYDGTRFPDVDFHHNVMTTASHRMPAVNGSGRIVNNLMYNWSRATSSDSGGGPSTYDIIGNYFRPGPMGRTADTMEIMFSRGPGSFYVAGNRSDVTTSPGPPAGRGAVTGLESDATQWSLLTGFTPNFLGRYTDSGGAQPAPATMRRTSALPSPGVAITVDAVSGLQSLLTAAGGVGMSRRLDCAGNWVNVSDAARDRILAYIAAGTGPTAVQASASAYSGGSLPALSAGTPCPDADHDGIPDGYELAACGTTTCMDAQAVQGDGYTNLEHYLDGR